MKYYDLNMISSVGKPYKNFMGDLDLLLSRNKPEQCLSRYLKNESREELSGMN